MKLSKILYLLAGVIFPIFIGSLHTYVHFKELVTPEISAYLQKQIPLQGDQQSLWNVLGVVSVMMGASFIVIGILNFAMLRNLSKTSTIPIIAIVGMMVYQFSVIYVGYEFDAPFQFYGGIFGIGVFLICLILTLRENSRT